MFFSTSLSNYRPDVESPHVQDEKIGYYRNAGQGPKVKEAVTRCCGFLPDPKKARTNGIRKLVRTSGFAGLTIAGMLFPGNTY
jgi:hypothetical protein